MVKVTLGTKKTERHESSYTKIVKYAMENVRIEDVIYLLSTMIRYRFTNESQSSIDLGHGCLTNQKGCSWTVIFVPLVMSKLYVNILRIGGLYNDWLME